jgi:hypothetical protein
MGESDIFRRKETISILPPEFGSMNISIPLFSIPLLVAALLTLLGFLVTPFSVRLGVIGIGAGSVILGIVAIKDLPMGFELQTIGLFGITAVVGLWMVSVGLKKQPGN